MRFEDAAADGRNAQIAVIHRERGEEVNERGRLFPTPERQPSRKAWKDRRKAIFLFGARVCERLGDHGKQALAVNGTLTFVSTAAICSATCGGDLMAAGGGRGAQHGRSRQRLGSLEAPSLVTTGQPERRELTELTRIRAARILSLTMSWPRSTMSWRRS